jgi:hypothetical protein
MSKTISDTVLDQALDYLKQNSDKLVLCNGEPSNYSDATTDNGSGGNALGETSVGTGDFTLADGDTDGRKATVASQSGVSVDADGTADHYALIDDGGSELLLVTTISNSQRFKFGKRFV